MPAQRLARILALLAEDVDGGAGHLCSVAATATVTTGAGIMLLSGDLRTGSLCSSDAVSAVIEELQVTLGEGPCVEAYALDEPVSEPDLRDPPVRRWPAFSPPAVAAGARAVFGFPMNVGAERLGALNLYCDAPGPLSPDQHADALVMADVAAREVLTLQANAAPGELGSDLEAATNLRVVVHQASGMVSAQLDVSVDDALLRLRAHAFAHDRSVTEVAEEVVTRRLRFD